MTAFEAVVAVALVGTAAASALAYQAQILRRAREVALTADLQSLRVGVEFFRATRGRYPAGLDELLAEPIGASRGRAGRSWSLQERGQQRVDAFGNPYYYDAKTGTVRSGTRGYKTR